MRQLGFGLRLLGAFLTSGEHHIEEEFLQGLAGGGDAFNHCSQFANFIDQGLHHLGPPAGDGDDRVAVIGIQGQ